MEASGKIVRKVLILSLLAATYSLVGARAQDTLVQSPDGPGLKPNPLAALRAFEPAANGEYEIGPGDELTLDFGGRAELTGKKIVGPDGRITIPLAGSILLADKTRDEAAATIIEALKPYYTNLAVTVGVDKYTSNRVLLLGAVDKPGIMAFDTAPTLLEVVTRGGVLGGASTGFGDNQVKRPTIPERCIIYRGSDKVMFVDLKKLLDSGSPLADMRLRRDDIVYIPSTADRYVSVLGQVVHPGAFQLEDSSTLRRLIAQAGGLTDAAGENPGIRVISPATGATRIVPMKTLLQPAPLDLTLKPGDIIFIPKSKFSRVSYVFDKISPLISIFTAFAFLEQ